MIDFISVAFTVLIALSWILLGSVIGTVLISVIASACGNAAFAAQSSAFVRSLTLWGGAIELSLAGMLLIWYFGTFAILSVLFSLSCGMYCAYRNWRRTNQKRG